jgi:glycerol-3-phosphate dehydrogenase
MSSDLQEIPEKIFDLLVLGGGINGAGVAREAALRGLSVCLLERDDWAQGSSSRTTKLVHGGLRYLETFQFRLVFEASRERRLLHGRLAPHLVRPVPILVPLYRGDKRSPGLVKLGLWLYDLLALFRNVGRHQLLSPRQVLDRIPHLNPEGLLGGAVTWDCTMHDARLVWENVLSARQAGALCLNYTSLKALTSTALGRVEALAAGEDGREFQVRARMLVNATGPWTDRTLQALTGKPSQKVRPSKGIHLVTAPLTGPDLALLASIREDGRVFFVVPRVFEGRQASLVGTTDTDFDGDPSGVHAETAEVAYLLEQCRRLLPGADLKKEDIWSTYAGVRPLAAPSQEGKVSVGSTPREAVLHLEDGILSMTGGKFTTYRPFCEQAVDRAVKALGLRSGRSRTASQALPGAPERGKWKEYLEQQTSALSSAHRIPESSAEWMLSMYGARAVDVLKLAEGNDLLKVPVESGFSPLLVEAAWASRHEDAKHLADFFLRRSFLGLVLPRGSRAYEKAAEVMGKELGWDPVRRRQELLDFKALLDSEYRGQ